jgi:hypothetical protein
VFFLACERETAAKETQKAWLFAPRNPSILAGKVIFRFAWTAF